ncbi:hypothetical protein UFOVP276_230 [uncultured Caudovirales phage]|uniref:Uncharacterized protein n=1 Tax=uncultured Caudovirales phage TaxID=2100421 RepID=A0A6J5LL52_9CAUD|nr:hypothetical protein UFOVP127_124 [uncultured Caudovirales phage]CAB4135274.1 hypothetical protein UFOVP276_230 [uncultured Caudovirales phage]
MDFNLAEIRYAAVYGAIVAMLLKDRNTPPDTKYMDYVVSLSIELADKAEAAYARCLNRSIEGGNNGK